MTISAFIFTVIFGAIGYFQDIKPNGKLSTGNIAAITFFLLLMITGITNLLIQDASIKDDKKAIFDKIDSATERIDNKVDTALQIMKKAKKD